MAAKKSRLNRRERENRLQRMVTEYEKQIAELSKRLELCMQELSFVSSSSRGASDDGIADCRSLRVTDSCISYLMLLLQL